MGGGTGGTECNSLRNLHICKACWVSQERKLHKMFVSKNVPHQTCTSEQQAHIQKYACECSHGEAEFLQPNVETGRIVNVAVIRIVYRHPVVLSLRLFFYVEVAFITPVAFYCAWLYTVSKSWLLWKQKCIVLRGIVVLDFASIASCCAPPGTSSWWHQDFILRLSCSWIPL